MFEYDFRDVEMRRKLKQVANVKSEGQWVISNRENERKEALLVLKSVFQYSKIKRVMRKEDAQLLSDRMVVVVDDNDDMRSRQIAG